MSDEPSPGERAAYAVLAEAGLPGAIFPYSHAIDEAFHLIPRTDLPAATVIDRDGVPHISVEGADAGTWKAAGNHAQARKWGLEYLAAAQAMEAWQAGQAAAEQARDKRRDELAADIVGPGWKYKSISPATRRAIDRIIELESK